MSKKITLIVPDNVEALIVNHLFTDKLRIDFGQTIIQREVLQTDDAVIDIEDNVKKLKENTND